MSSTSWQSVTISTQELQGHYARYRFAVRTGSNYRSDVAVDNVKICYSAKKLPYIVATMSFSFAPQKRDLVGIRNEEENEEDVPSRFDDNGCVNKYYVEDMLRSNERLAGMVGEITDFAITGGCGETEGEKRQAAGAAVTATFSVDLTTTGETFRANLAHAQKTDTQLQGAEITKITASGSGSGAALSTGAIAGIAVGGAVVLAGAITAAVIIAKKRSASGEKSNDHKKVQVKKEEKKKKQEETKKEPTVA